MSRTFTAWYPAIAGWRIKHNGINRLRNFLKVAQSLLICMAGSFPTFNAINLVLEPYMKRTLLAIAALAATSLASAVPIVITIDNFNSPNVGPVSAPLGGTSTNTDAVRTWSISTLAGPANGDGATLTIGSGTFPVGLLEVANASGRDTEVAVSYNLSAAVLAGIPANAFNISFFLQVVQSDGNPTDMAFTLGGAPLAAFAIAPNTINQGVSFGLNAAQLVALTAGGDLGLKLNGATGWDLTIDQFGFSYEIPASVPVPEPASLALVGLALAAAGFASRRKA